MILKTLGCVLAHAYHRMHVCEIIFSAKLASVKRDFECHPKIEFNYLKQFICMTFIFVHIFRQSINGKQIIKSMKKGVVEVSKEIKFEKNQ